MKFSAAFSISAVAALASAKAVPEQSPAEAMPLPAGMKGHGITPDSDTNVVVIWVNPGNGAETTTVNEQVTVTETVVVGAQTPPAVHPPPAEAAPPVHPPPAEAAPPAHPPPAEAPPVHPPPAEAPPVHPPPAEAPPVHPPAEAVPPTPVHPGAETPAAPAAGATHSVTVGGPGGLIYAPDQIHAAVGDMVVFTFLSANHTTTQSSFDLPCDPLAGGMDSGFIPNPNNTVEPPPQVAMQVMVSDPLWFYCAQGPHCGKGMVFSINPTAERTHAMFQSMAIQQKGDGAASPITGGEPPAAPPAAPPAEGAPPAGTEALPPLPGATDDPVAAPPAPGAGNGVQEGVGQIDQNGACVCTVQCDMGSFPNLDMQGVGSVGGMGGSIPIGQPIRKRW